MSGFAPLLEPLGRLGAAMASAFAAPGLAPAGLRQVELALMALAAAGLLLPMGAWAWRRRRRAAPGRGEAAPAGDGCELHVPGLLSRARFDAALAQATQSAHGGRGAADSVAVLFVNLDNFRTVNEGYGFAGGNEVLVQAGRRLRALLGEDPRGAQAQAMRMGVDEFVVCLPGAGEDLACALAGALCERMKQPFALSQGKPVVLGCSVGVALFPQHGAGPRLVSHAAQAMQAAKRAGGSAYMVFEPQMAVDMRAQSEFIADLRHAVQRGELELWYQPKVQAQGLQITAAEALLRWRHPKRGLVSPGVFIPVAERAGLISLIGDWVIDEATRQAAVWRSQGLNMRVAINLSAYQMRQDDLVDRIEEALKRHRLDPSRFTVEITESVAMEDTQVTQRSFARMRQAGLHVSIDDFGVGQASLAYLRRLPAAELKIDASFVKDVDVSEDARAIVDAVVNLAHALNLKVVAEGVETEAQRDQLIALGCDELQGYLFAKPMTARALATWAMLDGDKAYDAPGAADRAFRASLFHEVGSPAPH